MDAGDSSFQPRQQDHDDVRTSACALPHEFLRPSHVGWFQVLGCAGRAGLGAARRARGAQDRASMCAVGGMYNGTTRRGAIPMLSSKVPRQPEKPGRTLSLRPGQGGTHLRSSFLTRPRVSELVSGHLARKFNRLNTVWFASSRRCSMLVGRR